MKESLLLVLKYFVSKEDLLIITLPDIYKA